MAVFVLDKRERPLRPCSEKRVRLLLERGRARVHRMGPFTIRRVDRLREESTLQPIRLKLDPGSQTTGGALVRESESVDPATREVLRKGVVLMWLELQHRGHAIRDALTQRRRGNLRYRLARFDNRTKPKDWLAPSQQHRVHTTVSWVNRRRRRAPVTALSQELVRCDMQQMQNPEVRGIEYRQGELQGYEVRESLLEKWGRRCAYCDAGNVPREVEHIHPRSKGSSDRVSNLPLACIPCHQRKGHRDVRGFLSHDPKRLAYIEARRLAPLQDAAAVNSTRWVLWARLKATGLSVEVGSGGRTTWNRRRFGMSKAHGLDAAGGGHVDAVESWQQPVLSVKATGRGSYQRTRLTQDGFPREYLTRSKTDPRHPSPLLHTDSAGRRLWICVG